MRHAKSDWNNYDGDDLKRKVSPIGEKKTKLTKEFILSKNFLPDHVWCSPSIRTKETLEIPANIFSDKILTSKGLTLSSDINFLVTNIVPPKWLKQTNLKLSKVI